ncbi:MAG: 4-hydroxythreonine-4-phosphate dehydrogenase PdxA [Pseudoflavonifractor sp.]|nr:4-hydroxythreonine-4-phosphate dehydrogenase PdxA [Alloprevotella sp.]MCM1116221.1 4-hydroxythreonine-4-phosphate dehydrogenase PdxA [Pseudoflavonifractor sp.]
MSQDTKPVIGITHGDTNGIGYEVILKTLEDTRLLEICTPVVYGSARMAAYHRKGMNLPQVNFTVREEIDDLPGDDYTMVNVVGEDVKIDLGQPSPVAGAAALAALERATADLLDGKLDALVTAPINKHTIQAPGFDFPGHTEYLQAKADDGSEALMIMVAGGLRVALATAHMPISAVPAALTREMVASKIRAFDASLRRDFGIVRPRIAVLALNPHSGEHGLLGTEESEVISPAIFDVTAEKIGAFGPYAADGFFGSAQWTHFDGVLAMYHDQGLAPFKTVAMDSGVNFTAGLPFVRTSPDHGTGYDIAGKGIASPESMRAAIYEAIDIARRRMAHEERTANPLTKHYHERSRHDASLDLSKSDD